MKYLILLLVFLSSFANATNYTSIGNIIKLRTHSEFHPVAPVRKYIAFKLDQTLNAPCSWLYITPDEKNIYSMLLAAKLASKPVEISYSNAPSPWDASTCTVISADLN